MAQSISDASATPPSSSFMGGRTERSSLGGAALGVDIGELLAFRIDALGDSSSQGVRHVVLASVGDYLAKLGFESGRVGTRGAVVQMLSDMMPAVGGQLAV